MGKTVTIYNAEALYIIALTPAAASMAWTVDASIEETTYTTYPS